MTDFLAWCEAHALPSIAAVQPLHVAAWIEPRTQEHSAITVKQQLAAIRHLFDWLVMGRVIQLNPAASVRGPSHSVRKGKTPVLDPAEARALLDSIDVTTPIELRDRALIGLMVYSFGRIGAALAMRVEDVFVQNRRLCVRVREKGGKRHEVPCHHTLEEYLHAYLDGVGIAGDAKGPLFRTIGRGTKRLIRTPLPQANAYAVVRRRALAAAIHTKIGNHSFRATGIIAYLKNGGTLENAAAIGNDASTCTTQLSDRRRDDMSLDEVEPIQVKLTRCKIGRMWIDHTSHNTKRQYGSSTKAWQSTPSAYWHRSRASKLSSAYSAHAMRGPQANTSTRAQRQAFAAALVGSGEAPLATATPQVANCPLPLPVEAAFLPAPPAGATSAQGQRSCSSDGLRGAWALSGSGSMIWTCATPS